MTDIEAPGPAVTLKQLTLPLSLTLVYVAMTVTMYYFGPYAGQDPNNAAVGLFMLSVLVMFALGYWAGVRRTAGSTMSRIDEVRGVISSSAANRLVVIGSIWFLAYSLASLQRAGVTDPLTLLRAVSDPRDSYYAKFAHLESGNGNVVYRVLNLAGVFYFLTVPHILLHWRDLHRWVRGLSLASLGAYLVFFLSVGTQKGVADLMIMFFACALPIYVLRRSASATSTGGRLIGRRAWLVFGVAALSGLVLIAMSLGLRTDSTSTALQPSQARAMYESLSPFLGSTLGRGVVVLSTYASQGYHGLALALRLPFVPAGGLGAFKSLSSYLPQYFGASDPYRLSYPVRVQEAFGWSATGRWSTVYPWYASVISFPGVILLALVFGFFLARVWRRLMLACDGLTLSVFVTCVIVVLYSPANNQLFNERLSALGVLTLLGVYLLRDLMSRRKGRRRHRATVLSDLAPGPKAIAVGVFAPAFPPAYRGGGPIRSLEALVSRTPDGFAAYVLTSDRDLGATQRLPVAPNRWLLGERGATYYASLSSIRHLSLAIYRLRRLRPDVLYFNSFFNRPLTIVPLLLWRFRFWGRPIVLLAPRGEFGAGALTRHRTRKRIWITAFRLLKIHRSAVWQATSEEEAEEVRRMWGLQTSIMLYENDTLLPPSALEPTRVADGGLRLVFLGRVVEHKGVAIVLEALQHCRLPVSLDVYGPHEDSAYFETCLALAASIPPNVAVRFHDGVDHGKVRHTLSEFDLFVYPTAGENFGHAIAEALSSSCLVAATPTTPWTSVLREGGGIVVADRTPQAWLSAIESLALLTPDERLIRRRRAGEKYTEWANRPRGPHLWELILAMLKAAE